MKRNDLAGESARCRNANLLTEYGSDCQFKTIPATGRPQARTLRNQRREESVV